MIHRQKNENLRLGAKKYKKSACVTCKVYFPHEGFYNNHFMPYHKDLRPLWKMVQLQSRHQESYDKFSEEVKVSAQYLDGRDIK